MLATKLLITGGLTKSYTIYSICLDGGIRNIKLGHETSSNLFIRPGQSQGLLYKHRCDYVYGSVYGAAKPLVRYRQRVIKYTLFQTLRTLIIQK